MKRVVADWLTLPNQVSKAGSRTWRVTRAEANSCGRTVITRQGPLKRCPRSQGAPFHTLIFMTTHIHVSQSRCQRQKIHYDGMGLWIVCVITCAQHYISSIFELMNNHLVYVTQMFLILETPQRGGNADPPVCWRSLEQPAYADRMLTHNCRALGARDYQIHGSRPSLEFVRRLKFVGHHQYFQYFQYFQYLSRSGIGAPSSSSAPFRFLLSLFKKLQGPRSPPGGAAQISR